MTDDIVDAATVVPPTQPGGRIFTTLSTILSMIVAIFEDAEVPLPARRFIDVGEVAYDAIEDEDVDTGGLVAVSFSALRPGVPGTQQAQGVDPGARYGVEVEVHIIRTVPGVDETGAAPDPDEEITVAAGRFLTDLWTLQQGILAGRARGAQGSTTVPGAPGSLQGPPYRKIGVVQIVSYGPQGGVGGMRATLTCEVV